MVPSPVVPIGLVLVVAVLLVALLIVGFIGFIACSAVLGPTKGVYARSLGIYYFMVGLDWIMAETS